MQRGFPRNPSSERSSRKQFLRLSALAIRQPVEIYLPTSSDTGEHCEPLTQQLEAHLSTGGVER